MTCVERYSHSDDITVYATAGITEATFVKISGTRRGRADGSIYSAATADAAGLTFGVAKETVLTGQPVGTHGPGKIVPVLVGTGGVVAGTEGQVGTGGTVVTYASGIKACAILTTAAAGAYADCRIYG